MQSFQPANWVLISQLEPGAIPGIGLLYTMGGIVAIYVALKQSGRSSFGRTRFSLEQD